MDPRFTGMLLGSGMMWAFLQNQDIVGQPGPKPVNGAKAADFVVLRAQHLGELVDTIAHAMVQTFQPGPLSPIPVPGNAIPIAASLGDGRIAVAGTYRSIESESSTEPGRSYNRSVAMQIRLHSRRMRPAAWRMPIFRTCKRISIGLNPRAIWHESAALCRVPMASSGHSVTGHRH